MENEPTAQNKSNTQKAQEKMMEIINGFDGTKETLILTKITVAQETPGGKIIINSAEEILTGLPIEQCQLIVGVMHQDAAARYAKQLEKQKLTVKRDIIV